MLVEYKETIYTYLFSIKTLRKGNIELKTEWTQTHYIR